MDPQDSNLDTAFTDALHDVIDHHTTAALVAHESDYDHVHDHSEYEPDIDVLADAVVERLVERTDNNGGWGMGGFGAGPFGTPSDTPTHIIIS